MGQFDPDGGSAATGIRGEGKKAFGAMDCFS
jgi:hypothetical protein